ncbi:uncharacterized protein LOC134274340 [Saccostrea cucullata]|uniref:uncharacterized protein LOC134274340 n=1 Tax=Saccostrea cuccullata TaxID=36930 RepID=UPI002ED51566
MEDSNAMECNEKALVILYTAFTRGTRCLTLPNNACEESLRTIAYVSACPTDFKEYQAAAIKKNCRQYNQTCRSFEYHCVLNDDMTRVIEVCAPWRYIQSGKCTEFNIGLRSIRKIYKSDCTDFPFPCPTYYNSTESYRYTGCYRKITTPTIRTSDMTTRNETVSYTTKAVSRPENQTYETTKREYNIDYIGISFGITIPVVLLMVILCVYWRTHLKQKGIRTERKSYFQVSQNSYK